METSFWVTSGLQLAGIIVAGGSLYKYGLYLISKDKIRAQADSTRADAEAKRTSIYEKLIDNIMIQLDNVRNENLRLVQRIAEVEVNHAKELSQTKLQHMKDMDEERRSCAEQMSLLNERLRGIEGRI